MHLTIYGTEWPTLVTQCNAPKVHYQKYYANTMLTTLLLYQTWSQQ